MDLIFSRRAIGLLLVFIGALMPCRMQAQSTAVTTSHSGVKVYLEIDAFSLRSNLDTLFERGAALQGQVNNLSWADVLENGTTPGVDVNFFGYDATGLGNVTTTGTFTGDSLVLNKDAGITGRLTITGVTTVNDSLKASGFVAFSDSLEVIRAVSIGETLFVTGVTSLGDSMHVVGNVDLDAMLNVDGAVTFGSTLSVTGETTLNDSLLVNSGVAISQTLLADSISVTDVINGQVSDLTNHNTDALSEGTSNLYYTDARARGSLSGSTGVTYTSATGAIAIGQSVGTTDDVSFAGISASGTVTADSISVTDVINGRVSNLTNHNTDALSEGNSNLYYTDARARGSLSGSTGVNYSSATGAIAIGQSVGTTDDVSFAGISASGTVTADSISVTDVINGQVSDLSNHDSDALSEGITNLYFTASERALLASLPGVINTLDSLISIIDGVITTLPGFAVFTTCGDPIGYDGYDYATVQIGEQCWFAENLRNNNYNDGTAIPEKTDGADWASLLWGAQCTHENDEANLATFGRLYNWYAVSTDKLCPSGWHVPLDDEWTTLVDGLGGDGGKLKSTPSAWNGTNESGFSALPGANRDDSGNFGGDSYGYWWSRSVNNSNLNQAWSRFLITNPADYVGRSAFHQRYGFSVRCIQSPPLTMTITASEVSDGDSSSDATLSLTFTASGYTYDFTESDITVTNGTLSDFTVLSWTTYTATFTPNELGACSIQVAESAFTSGEFDNYNDATEVFNWTQLPPPGSSVFNACGDAIGYNGYDYQTVQIGSQCWFAENLRNTDYNDGALIPSGLDDSAWQSTTEGAMTIYGEGSPDEATNLATYGRLYNWHAVNTGKMCPSGWHVPSDGEWTTLTDGLGGWSAAGEKMKSTPSAWNGTNESGFSGLPGGDRSSSGSFSNVGWSGSWWSSTASGTAAWNRSINSDYNSVGTVARPKGYGYSIRCVLN